MGYRFERISQSNFDSFIEVFEASFEKKADTDFLKNKFRTDWSGVSFLGFLAFEEATSDPAAFYGVYPVLAQYKGEQLLIAQSGDTATSPRHRRKGLFRQLHDKTIDLCAAEGVKLIFGFPNENSYPGFMKFGWSHEQNVQIYYKLLNMSLEKRLMKRFFPKCFHLRQLDAIRDKSVDNDQLSGASPTFVAEHSLHVSRTKEYLKYKNDLGAESIQLVNGRAVIAVKENQLTIGEVYADNLDELIKEITSLGYRCGSEKVLVASDSQILATTLQSKLSKGPAIPIIVKVLDPSMNGVNFSCSSLDFDTF